MILLLHCTDSVVKNGSHMVLKHNQSANSLDDLVELLTVFKHDNGFNEGLVEQLHTVTVGLKQYLHSSRASEQLEGQKPSQKASTFSKTKKEIENIINDSAMHPGIRAALLRKKLRNVGIFAWNADLEGMIFGYGYDLHDRLVVASMPRSIKDFCLEEKELSGLAYERYISMAGGSTAKREFNQDDAERICYLVEISKEGRLTSREVSKEYKLAFGTRFRSERGGVHYPFRVLVDNILKNPNIKVTSIDDYEAFILLRERSEKGRSGSAVGDDECDEFFNDTDVLTPEPSAKKDKHIPLVLDNDVGVKKSFVGVLKNDFDLLAEDVDIEADTNSVSGERSEKGGRKPRRSRDAGSQSPMRQRSSVTAASQKYPSLPRTDDAVYEDDTKDYLFEWVGEEPRDVHKEHPQHVFQSPSYWRFVGSVLHGSKERAGLWRSLPWAVLKDVIYCTKNIRVPDNKASGYMSSDEMERYGKALSSAGIHLGLRDLMEWMEDMETRGLIPV